MTRIQSDSFRLLNPCNLVQRNDLFTTWKGAMSSMVCVFRQFSVTKFVQKLEGKPVDDDIAFVYCVDVVIIIPICKFYFFRYSYSKEIRKNGGFLFNSQKKKRIPSWHVRRNSHAFVSFFFLILVNSGVNWTHLESFIFEYLIVLDFFLLHKEFVCL